MNATRIDATEQKIVSSQLIVTSLPQTVLHADETCLGDTRQLFS